MPIRQQKVYASQYGTVWSLRPAAWRKVVRLGLFGEGYDLDTHGKRLATAPRPYYEVNHCLDWDEEDWAAAARAAGMNLGDVFLEYVQMMSARGDRTYARELWNAYRNDRPVSNRIQQRVELARRTRIGRIVNAIFSERVKQAKEAGEAV